LAFFTWSYFQPSLEQTIFFKIGWITKMFVRNVIFITLVAGCLHLFLYVRKTQGDQLKFDSREMPAKGRLFTFGTQLRDNMFWTLTSGVFFWTAFEVLMFWGMANGYVPVFWWVDNPV
jgi:lathosterol oxidase